MFETIVTVVGTAITDPQVRETNSGRVASFQVVGTSRRFDRRNGRWVDGDRFFATVNCWKRLADGVIDAVCKRAPVLVTGRLRTSDYEVGGQRRWVTEIDASAVGLDLARTSAPGDQEVPGQPALDKVHPG